MKPAFRHAFKIRFSECDMYSHVNNAFYLRYMRETTTDAEREAGYSPERYRKLGYRWRANRAEIEYLQPLVYGEIVEVVAQPVVYTDEARRINYEFRKGRTGELAARAIEVSILIETETGDRHRIPSEIVEALLPEAEKISEPLDSDHLNTGKPEGVFTWRCKVTFHDVLENDELDMTALLAYAGDSGREVLSAHKWPVERMLAEKSAIILRRNQISYYMPVKGGEEIEIATWVSDIKRATAVRHYYISRLADGELLAKIQALGVWVNLETGQPMRFSEEFLDDLAPNIG